ncbi:hypothetical protein EK904_008093 [Melospiza melodia maxima]|nr:hypothetical protein EK904_008093 [Melospiza melodia maxima]
MKQVKKSAVEKGEAKTMGIGFEQKVTTSSTVLNLRCVSGEIELKCYVKWWVTQEGGGRSLGAVEKSLELSQHQTEETGKMCSVTGPSPAAVPPGHGVSPCSSL